MQQCPECHRPMVWSGTGANRLMCPECDLGVKGSREPKEENITDLKRAGKCYCHLMVGRVCETCKKVAKRK